MNDITIGRYTFSELVELAETDIDKFNLITEEIKRDELNKICVDSPNKRRRLEGLQFTIDARMKKIKNPLVRAQKMYSIMLEEGFYPLRDNLQQLCNIEASLPDATIPTLPTTAKIIPLKTNNK